MQCIWTPRSVMFPPIQQSHVSFTPTRDHPRQQISDPGLALGLRQGEVMPEQLSADLRLTVTVGNTDDCLHTRVYTWSQFISRQRSKSR